MSNTGLLFIVVGPTGAGKNALMNDAILHLPPLRQMPTATTRPRRRGEKQGRERFFVSPDEFQQMIREKALLEWQEVHPDRFYGVPRSTLETALENGEFLIADIDVLGASYIRSAYPQNVILIFVKPTSIDELASRMQIRGDDEEDIHTRLKRVAMEMEYLPVADYVVVNDDFDQAAERFRGIVTAEMQQHGTRQREYQHHVTTIPIYQDDVLWHEEAPHFIETTLKTREIPHDAALRSLEASFDLETHPDQLLRMKSNLGSFVSPVQVEAQDAGPVKQIRFTYVYLLTSRITIPADWCWRPSDQIALPAVARQILGETSE